MDRYHLEAWAALSCALIFLQMLASIVLYVVALLSSVPVSGRHTISLDTLIDQQHRVIEELYLLESQLAAPITSTLR